ncbi:MAG: hypothetical protein IPK20_22540 [Betaproteobacteria bacterium]|nr:hypothetical protein [Betaproteobacteria bacterium]
MRLAASVVTGASPSTSCSSTVVSSGAMVSNSTRACAVMVAPVCAESAASTV